MAVDLSEVRINSRGEYLEKDVNKSINVKTQNQAAVDFFLQMKDKQSQIDIELNQETRPLTTIAFASSVPHAQRLADHFMSVGIEAAAVWGNQDEDEQNKIFERFENGEIEVLCSKDLLRRGVDFPKVRMALNIAPTLSPFTEIQRSGRALRLDPDNPTKHAYVVDFIYTMNKRSKQVTFSEMLGAASLYREYPDDDSQIPEAMKIASENIGQIQVNGLKIIVDSEEIMIITKGESGERISLPPEGWMTSNQVDTNHGVPPRFIAKIIHELRDLHPEWFAIYKSVIGVPREHLSPELIEIMKQRYVEIINPAPDNWITTEELARTLKVDTTTAIKYFEELPEIYSGGSVVFRHHGKRPARYFSPEVVELLIEKRGSPTIPPEGWMTLGGIASILDIDRKTVGSRIKQLQEQEMEVHSEDYLNSTGRLTAYYSPSTINLLKEKFTQTAPPQGWMYIGSLESTDSIAHLIGRDGRWIAKYIDEVVKSIINEYKHKNVQINESDLYGTFKVRNGYITVHYSPKVIQRLKKISLQSK